MWTIDYNNKDAPNPYLIKEIDSKNRCKGVTTASSLKKARESCRLGASNKLTKIQNPTSPNVMEVWFEEGETL